jgi:outer membrane protein TolC
MSSVVRWARHAAAAAGCLICFGATPLSGSSSAGSTALQDSAGLTLADAVQRAIEVQPVMRGAAAELARSEAGLRVVRSARLPDLAIQLGGTRFQEPMIVAPLHGFDPQSPPDFDRLLIQGQAVAGFTLFDGGARGARIDGARAAADAAEAGAGMARAGLIERTVRSYIEVGAAREIVRANAARVSTLGEEQARTERMLAAGSVPRVAVLRAEAALASARADHAAATAQLRRAEADLARLLDTPADSMPGMALQSVLAPASVVEPDRTGLIESAYERNPSVQRARAGTAAAGARISEAGAAFWPALALSGGYNAFGSGAGGWVGEWQAALRLSWPVFTGGRRSGGVDRARADAEAAAAALEQLQLDVSAEIDAGLARLAGAFAQASALAVAVDQFAEVVDIEALSLSAGAGVQPDYLRAVSDLLDAQAALTRARAEVVATRVGLARLAGELDAEWILDNLEVQ